MKRVALKGSWDTPPTPMHRKWKVADANNFIQRLSLEAPGSPKRMPLALHTTLDDWVNKDTSIATKDISPTSVKAVSLLAKPKAEVAIRRKVGLAVCGEGDEHRDPSSQSSENGSRITAIVRALDESKDLSSFLVPLSESTRPASNEELLKVHTKGYLNKLQKLTLTSSEIQSKALDRMINSRAVEEFDSVYMTSKSFHVARRSAGAAITCAEALCRGEVSAAAAAIRPPGHHAEAHCAMGFCFFNNAALATKRALELGMKRVLIVDMDIHHGNGTQRAFWDDDRVLYFSAHRWDKGRFYPHNECDAAPSCVGPKDSPAAGKTMNVAFCDGEMGDLEYRAVWETVLLPVVKEFNPDFIVISAGYDAAEGDPIGKYHVSPACFGAMVSSLSDFAPRAKMLMLLEGGYNTKVTAAAFCECVRALSYVSSVNGPPARFEWPNNSGWSQIKQQAVDAINATISSQSGYWKCLKPVIYSPTDGGRSLIQADN